MSQIDHGSQVSNDQNDNDDSYNQAQLQNMKQQISLSNVQLLQLTYNDQKFFQKLHQLNHIGCQYMTKLKYYEALIYLNEAQKILEYAASCGKTIQRSLIITILNNQAALYQKNWELQKAASYIQAIIYNISSFFEQNSTFIFTQKIVDCQSSQNEDFSIFISRKISLSLYYLQFCAVNSQNKNHENAFSSAFKAVNILKQICSDQFKYEQYCAQNNQKEKLIRQQSNIHPYKMILYELANLKQLDHNHLNANFQKYYQNTLKYMAGFIKRTKQQISQSINSHYHDVYKQHFANYSIGYLMQINPIKIQRNQEKISLKEEFSDIKKIFKSVYISVGFFILATELRFISTEKYTLDQNQRKNSIQYKESQIYHLISIIIASKYLPCESVYFQHIVNSFRNHYKIDILQDAKKYVQNYKENINQDDSFSSLYQQGNKNHKKQQTFHKSSNSGCLKQFQQEKLQITKKQVKNMNIPVQNTKNQSQSRHTSSISTQKDRERYLLTQQEQYEKKISNQQNYNLQFNKKAKLKLNKNKLTKSQHKLHQSNKVTQSSHKQQKNKKINIQYATSREKENKNKNKISYHASKKSRDASSHNTLSRKKSRTHGLNQILSNTKKTNQDNNQNKNHLNFQNALIHNNEYYKTNKSRSKTKKQEDNKKSKSKSKTSASAHQQKKMKKNQYFHKKTQLDQDNEIPQKRGNLKKSNNNGMKKTSFNQTYKVGSPIFQSKKTVKSPKNLKKSNNHTSRQKLFF